LEDTRRVCEFDEAINMASAEIEDWLATGASRSVREMVRATRPSQPLREYQPEQELVK
jgi:hypothetical protein